MKTQVLIVGAGPIGLGLSPVRKAMVDNMAEISVGYDRSPLNGVSFHGATCLPGRRLAPIAGWIMPGSGSRPRFAVFAENSNELRMLIERFPGLVDPSIKSPVDPGAIVLVRPDGYVACTAKSGNVDVISRYLGAIAVAEKAAA